jgi:predicted ATPase
MMAGWARSGLGDYHSGVSQFRQGLAGWKSSGARAGMTFFPATAAECCRRAGWLDQAAELVAEAADIVQKNDEHYYEAELFRIQGDLAVAAGDLDAAEERFRAGMALAATQQAKPFELRNAMSLARLLAGRGRAQEGRQLVAGLHSWFTEGADTEDLAAARKLLGGK